MNDKVSKKDDISDIIKLINGIRNEFQICREHIRTIYDCGTNLYGSPGGDQGKQSINEEPASYIEKLDAIRIQILKEQQKLRYMVEEFTKAIG